MALFPVRALDTNVRAYLAHRDRVLCVDGSARLDDDRPTVDVHLRDRQLECVAAHPDAPDRAFVGTFDDGLFATRDGGQSFERAGAGIGPSSDDRSGVAASDDGVTGRGAADDTAAGSGAADDAPSITALAVDPASPEVVWAGTEPSRLYRSTDGGRSFERVAGLLEVPSAGEWSFPPRPHTHHVRWIEPDPHDPERCYVGVEAGALVYTTDGGETWHDRPTGSRRDNHQLATHPDAAGRVYAAAGDGYATSTDGGETWTAPQDGLEHRYVWNVLPDPGDSERVLVSAATGASSAHSAPGESYLYRRDGDTDGDGAAGGADQDRANGGAYEDRANGGADDATWERLDGPLSGEGVLRAVLATDGEPGHAYGATNRGLYVSRDFGDSWSAVDVDWPAALEEQTARGLAVVPT